MKDFDEDEKKKKEKTKHHKKNLLDLQSKKVIYPYVVEISDFISSFND